jgi:hypothetical protein
VFNLFTWILSLSLSLSLSVSSLFSLLSLLSLLSLCLRVSLFQDIQWADRFSLEAIESLVSNPACQHTLILLASRLQGDTREAQLLAMLQRLQELTKDNQNQTGSGTETDFTSGTVTAEEGNLKAKETHQTVVSLVLALAATEEQGSLSVLLFIENLSVCLSLSLSLSLSLLQLLQPLQLDSITQLVSDTLCCSLFKSLSLASFLLTQTSGSPLFVNQVREEAESYMWET